MADTKRERMRLDSDTDDGYTGLLFRGGTVTLDMENASPDIVDGTLLSSWEGTGLTAQARRLLYQFNWADQSANPVVSVGGFLLDPFLFESANLQLTAKTLTTGTPTVKVYLVNHPQPGDFDTANIWGPRPNLMTGTLPAPDVIQIDVADASGNRPGTLIDTVDVAYNIQLDVGRMMSVVRDDGGTAPWEGKFRIIVTTGEDEFRNVSSATKTADVKTVFYHGGSNSGSTSARPRLSIDFFKSSHTGQVDALRRKSRAVHDNRLGFPAESAEVIEDGFVNGLYVHHWDHDDDDPYEIDRPPNPMEGITDGKPVR